MKEFKVEAKAYTQESYPHALWITTKVYAKNTLEISHIIWNMIYHTIDLEIISVKEIA